MTPRLEHANLCVEDIDGVVRFLQVAFPEFRIRHESTNPDGGRWLHVGTDASYVALTERRSNAEAATVPYSGRPGLNHLGFEVDDVGSVQERLTAAGYRESGLATAHPHRRRVYFYDPDGNDWEFVQYLSTDLSQRHDYALPDHFEAHD